MPYPTLKKPSLTRKASASEMGTMLITHFNILTIGKHRSRKYNIFIFTWIQRAYE